MLGEPTSHGNAQIGPACDDTLTPVVFYISSRGHSATLWLAKTLMSRGGVVCFHGTRSIGGSRTPLAR